MATPSDPNRTSKIEVDLQILQDSNLTRLNEFTDKFEKNIDRLHTAIGSMSDLITQKASGASPGASTGNELDNIVLPSRLGGVSPGANWGFGGYLYSGQPSLATPTGVGGIPPRVPPGGASVADAGELPDDAQPPEDARSEYKKNEYLRAQFELGQVGEGPLAMLRYIAGGLQSLGKDYTGRPAIGKPGEPGYQPPSEDYDPNRPNNTFRFGNWLESKTRAVTIAKGAVFGTYQNVANMAGLPPLNAYSPSGSLQAQQFGVNVGGNTAGGGLGFLNHVPIIGGLANLFSPAGMAGIKADLYSQWEGLKTMFGFGNDVTTEQARAVENTLNQLGWGRSDSGNAPQFDFLRDRMIKYTGKYRGVITPEQMTNMGYDAAVRFGTSSLQELNQVMDNMGVAAKAANMGLSAFVESLINAAQETSNATGAPMSASMLGIQSASMATGLAPSIVGKMSSSKRNMFLGMMMTHTQPWQIVEGKKSPATIGMAGAIGYLGPGLGDYKVWQAAKKQADAGNLEPLHQLENMLWMRYESDPEIFGGLKPQDIENQMLRGDPVKHASAITRLQKAHTWDKAPGSILPMFKAAGATPQEIRKLEKWRRDHLDDFQRAMKIKDEGKRNHELNRLVNQQRGEALNLLGVSMQKNEAKAASRTSFTLDLTQPAKELVVWLKQQSGGKSHTNSQRNNYGRPSSGQVTQDWIHMLGSDTTTRKQIEGNR